MASHPRLARLFNLPWAAEVFALAGGVVFSVQLWIYAHTQASVLDEGLYLFKGLLFASGRYQPFQDYGPLTNHMALAFLIPGYIQQWFGPGLRAGRYFAILISLLMLLGLWITARRMGGKWLAVGVVWAIAINPAVAKLSSQAISEGLIACMMIWVMVLTLGERRPRWQVIMGAVLAGILVMTRINLLPVLPLTLLYIFWQHGWTTGLWSTLVGGVVFILFHLLYWPNVLRLWAYWLPERITPFLRTFRPPAEALPSWESDVPLKSRLMSLLQGLRYHALAICGALVSWMLWPQRKKWQSSAHFRAAVFLSALLVSLTVMHAWASLGQNYCVYCFPLYLNFFISLGLLLLVVTLASWLGDVPPLRQGVAALVVLGLCAFLGFGAFSDFNDRFLQPLFARGVLRTAVPRFQSLHILPGSVPLWTLLANKFNLAYEQCYQLIRAIPGTLAGLLTGLLILIVAWTAWRIAKRRYRFGGLALIFFLAAIFLLTPSFALGGGFTSYDCSGDVIASNETAGKYLAEIIPPGSQVYWKGGLSPVPLLYLPDVGIYPPQLNGDYSLRLGGDADALLRYGWWSQPLAEQWADEADIVLIEDKYYTGWYQERFPSPDYIELPISPPVVACHSDARIHIFQRQP